MALASRLSARQRRNHSQTSSSLNSRSPDPWLRFQYAHPTHDKTVEIAIASTRHVHGPIAPAERSSQTTMIGITETSRVATAT
jgi:hypothetical protein